MHIKGGIFLAQELVVLLDWVACSVLPKDALYDV